MLEEGQSASKSASLNGTAAAHQIDDQDHQRYHQQQVDQTTSHMKTETQKPQNQDHNENRPKHLISSGLSRIASSSLPRVSPRQLNSFE
jgi:hypothetical protein